VNTHLNGFEVDFHWPDLELAIELDGPGHERARTQREDAHKERAWRKAGYELLRFGDPLAAARSLAAAAKQRTTAA
jgi:very-short-patch-repair endonuclease